MDYKTQARNPQRDTCTVQEICAFMHERKRKGGRGWQEEILALKFTMISKQILHWSENQWDIVIDSTELVTRETEGPSLGS